MTPFPPPTLRGLDPEWIAEHSTVDGRRPLSATFGGFIGTGQMSRNARFSLDWGDDDGPASVVVKLPSSDPNTTALSFEHSAYLRECTFYRDLAPLVDVRVPNVLTVDYDAEAQDFAIVLEDLAGSEQGDQFTEPSDDQLELAIEQCAALHAPLWGRTDRPELDLYRDEVDNRVVAYDATIPGLVDAVLGRLGPGLEPHTVGLLERFAAVAGHWARLSHGTTTLVHHDFRPDNLLFGVSDDAPAIAVVDWQTCRLGEGASDVAYLLGAAITPERRRATEERFLQHYVEGLERRGVRGFGLDRCRDDYAVASLHGVVVAIRAASVAEQTERGDAMLTLMANRHARHALDVGILDRLESMA